MGSFSHQDSILRHYKSPTMANRWLYWSGGLTNLERRSWHIPQHQLMVVKIWTRVANSISYGNNCYTNQVSFSLHILADVFFYINHLIWTNTSLSKVNKIVFELVYFEIAVQYFRHYAMGTPRIWLWGIFVHLYICRNCKHLTFNQK